ncbi:flagellar biosynthesis anti-sigma factor FlgM [Caballeronia sp. LP006]|uniref:flagellar biosynthesis anti-sigma factor FlgM n=1 Tax=unclassified Caballeronia TaxID=2646786 RepID=UPI001FD034F8|nr:MULTISPECIES: flagellar biosynthesis anti-sigma factor FlgM [unclassified Caballeronia]MDR5828203.1 flagellar biosynthesis anti-sigma factor FlgM [Caballeronia sp. LP006]
MKIESNNTPAALQSDTFRVASKRDVQATGGVQQTSATNATSSKVTLSSLSSMQVTGGADIDTAKVESIKAALRDGTYKIDSGKIASGMLSTAGDLLKTTMR